MRRISINSTSQTQGIFPLIYQNLKNPYNVEHFLLATEAHNVKKVELFKHSKINKNAPTCFDLHETIFRELKSVLG